jgi:hypothetical protein
MCGGFDGFDFTNKELSSIIGLIMALVCEKPWPG